MNPQDLTAFLYRHPMLSMGVVVVLLLLVILEVIKAKAKISTLSPLAATQMLNHQHAVIIDIRPHDSYRQGHIVDALSLTAAEVEGEAKKLKQFKNKPVIIVCAAGMESQKAVCYLEKQGYNAYSLAGGMRAWSAANMPLVKESSGSH
ncbi:MAG TPA: rhodanese-like domain-containing protein [Gammaproteobacteria bacterium]|jgi:rhodanese-related sulfurtransferase|nr:rhodanese-like domain-containing protein [Gammaproteobacteria bacterium]